MLQIAIDAFHGPLDLLLYLVKRNEMDVRDIPVAQIAAEFLDYLEAIQTIDVDWAGDFLVLAATLIELKSKLLLPRPDVATAGEADDPRRELVKQLVEYRKTKEAAGHLERLAEERQFLVGRTPPDDEEGATSPRFRRVELWDLVSAFGRLVRETQASQPLHLVSDETPQSSFTDWLRGRVLGKTAFRDVFVPPHTRPRLIGVFLAILELMRSGDLELLEADGSIWLMPSHR